MIYGITAHNKRLTLRRLFGGSGLRSARSVALRARSHASLQPQFASPGLCSAKPLFGLPNRRQPRTLYEIKNEGIRRTHRVHAVFKEKKEFETG